jgi:hypothetical protein
LGKPSKDESMVNDSCKERKLGEKRTRRTAGITERKSERQIGLFPVREKEPGNNRPMRYTRSIPN